VRPGERISLIERIAGNLADEEWRDSLASGTVTNSCDHEFEGQYDDVVVDAVL
jgi:hypothetical protein